MSSPDEMRFLTAFGKLDGIERAIFIAGLRALADHRITTEQFTERVQTLCARHRAGEDLRVSDLENLG